MKHFLILFLFAGSFVSAFAQEEQLLLKELPDNSKAARRFSSRDVVLEKLNAATPVKNQAQTGTCWCFSGTSLLESQLLSKNSMGLDLSEMFTVRNIYLEKAKNYYLRQGHAQFGEGGLGHDVIRAVNTYGAVPESAFSGLPAGQTSLNHNQLIKELQGFLDSAIAHALKGQPEKKWLTGVNKILDNYIGNPPEEFSYAGKKYTPKTFARDYLKFNADDYVNITSFTDHPYYAPFVISVPDNFSNGAYYNVPLNEMTALTKNAVRAGYTVLWDADVSNSGFSQKTGAALYLPAGLYPKTDSVFVQTEKSYTPELRQELFEDLTTQDDHLMHIIGLEKNKAGKSFFIVKNSWGTVGPYQGYINVSEAYFEINTISLVVPKAALSKALLDKLQIK